LETGTPHESTDALAGSVAAAAARFWDAPRLSIQELTEGLIDSFRRVPPADALEALLSVCETSEVQQEQEIAGRLLVMLRHALPRPSSLPAVLARVVPSYNLSVRSIPVYLALRFGAVELVAELARMRERSAGARDIVHIDGIRYWVNNEDFPEILDSLKVGTSA
jgi:hypothetical protein